jgi:hypothetical protein
MACLHSTAGGQPAAKAEAGLHNRFFAGKVGSFLTTFKSCALRSALVKKYLTRVKTRSPLSFNRCTPE